MDICPASPLSGSLRRGSGQTGGNGKSQIRAVLLVWWSAWGKSKAHAAHLYVKGCAAARYIVFYEMR